MSDDCPCRAIPAKGDPQGHITAGVSGVTAPVKKTRRPKVLRGSHCVISKKSGKPFNCTHSREAAEKLQQRLGDRFKVGPNPRNRSGG